MNAPIQVRVKPPAETQLRFFPRNEVQPLIEIQATVEYLASVEGEEALPLTSLQRVVDSEKGLRQKHLAQRLNISRNTFWERRHPLLRRYCIPYRLHYRRQREKGKGREYTPFMQWCLEWVNALFKMPLGERMTEKKAIAILKSQYGRDFFSFRTYKYSLNIQVRLDIVRVKTVLKNSGLTYCPKTPKWYENSTTISC